MNRSSETLRPKKPHRGLGGIILPVLLGFVLLGVATVVLFYGLGGNKEPSALSRTRAAPTGMDSTQGAHVHSSYDQAVDIEDQRRIEEAKREGGSAMSTFTKGQKPDLSTAEVTESKTLPGKNTTGTNSSGKGKSSQRNPYEKQMRSIIEGSRPKPAKVLWYADAENLIKPTKKQPLQQKKEPSFVQPVAGTILYGAMVSEANSDAPGAVLAKLLQGDYSGATLIGSFQTQGNGMVINFHTLSMIEQGVSFPIKAVAVNSRNIGTNVATDINRHIASKLAIAFISGFAEGIAESVSDYGHSELQIVDQTVIASDDPLNTEEKAIIAGGRTISKGASILEKEFGNRPATVKVERGTDIGILFL